MKLIEALKELKHIDKKMAKNIELITKYSSQPSKEKPILKDEANQRATITSLVESNRCHEERRRWLKMRIEFTNLMTVVEIKGKKFTISELIQLKQRGGAEWIIKSFQAMNDLNYHGGRRVLVGQAVPDEEITRYYDEEFKQKQIEIWQDLVNAIDGQLEVKTAMTELIELPDNLYAELERTKPSMDSQES